MTKNDANRTPDDIGLDLTAITPEQARAEQERWQKRIDAYDAALAKVCLLSDERTARHDAMVQAAGKKGEYCPPIPDPTPEHWDASEAWADAQKDLPDPTLARQYAALLAAHAEALAAQRWIPVSERLPENEDELVQVATETQKMVGVKVAVLTGYYSNDSKGGYFAVLESINGGRIYGLSHLHDQSPVVTHWRPLPAPPAPASAGGEG